MDPHLTAQKWFIKGNEVKPLAFAQGATIYLCVFMCTGEVPFTPILQMRHRPA